MAERFGRYWLHEKIGHGGMAEIYRATIGPDPETYAFDLAFKRMHPHLENDQTHVDMFLTEADVAKFLRHPNLVRVYEAGLIGGRAYISMEYVWGHDLSRLITVLGGRGLRFPSDLAVYLALQLLRALDYVHRARSPGGVSMELVHRDVTPSNVYVTLFGEVKLGDFGVARISFLESHEDDDVGLLKGKAAYMPPEVLAGGRVDQAVDLWGVACILYEMLTARRVYEGVTERDLMEGVEPPPILAVERANPEVDRELAKIVNRALSRKPKRRPADSLAFYKQLKLYLRGCGVDVDAQAMSRYVAEVTGSAPTSQRQNVPDESSFSLPEYEVPIGASPTQRFERRERNRARMRPFIIVGGLLMAAVIAFGVQRLTRQSELPDPQRDAVVEPPVVEDHHIDFDLSVVDSDAIELGAEPTELSHIKDPAVRVKALLHRGRIQLRRGRAESALDAYRVANDLRPEHVGARLGQATALLALTRYEEAEKQVNVVLESRPRHTNAYLVLGDITAARGDLAQARWAYDRCIKLAPASKAARTARKALSKL